MANYKWRNGFKPKVDAEVAGKEMDKILTSTGTLESEAIVAAAKPKRSALHPAFEWDDAKAANLHRLEHAGMLRRHLIHFVEAEGTNEPVEHRAYDFIEAEDKRTWRSTLEIMSKPDEREQLLARALREAAQYQRRYKHLEELAEVMAAIDSVVA